MSKDGTQTLSKTALSFFRLRRQVFIFFKLCVEAIPLKKSEREELFANFEHRKRLENNSTYPQWLDFLGFTLVFHEQNFILAERTLLAFPPLRVAAKRCWKPQNEARIETQIRNYSRKLIKIFCCNFEMRKQFATTAVAILN